MEPDVRVFDGFVYWAIGMTLYLFGSAMDNLFMLYMALFMFILAGLKFVPLCWMIYQEWRAKRG